MVIELKHIFYSLRTLKHTYGLKSELFFAGNVVLRNSFVYLFVMFFFKVIKSFVRIATFKIHIALNQNELISGLPKIWHN